MLQDLTDCWHIITIKKSMKIAVPEEVIMDKIYLIRDEKVVLDSDLADLYQVATKRLDEQVKRNQVCFPEDFIPIKPTTHDAPVTFVN